MALDPKAASPTRWPFGNANAFVEISQKEVQQPLEVH